MSCRDTYSAAPTPPSVRENVASASGMNGLWNTLLLVARSRQTERGAPTTLRTAAGTSERSSPDAVVRIALAQIQSRSATQWARVSRAAHHRREGATSRAPGCGLPQASSRPRRTASNVRRVPRVRAVSLPCPHIAHRPCASEGSCWAHLPAHRGARARVRRDFVARERHARVSATRPQHAPRRRLTLVRQHDSHVELLGDCEMQHTRCRLEERGGNNVAAPCNVRFLIAFRCLFSFCWRSASSPRPT